MAKRRLRARDSSTTPGASNEGTTNPTQEETTVPSPAMVNGEGIEVTPEVENEEIHTSEEGTNEEVANMVIENGEVAANEGDFMNEDNLTSEGVIKEVAVMKNGEVAVEEEENEEAAIDKERAEMAAIEREVEDEPSSAEQKAGEYSEEEDKEEEDDEEKDDAEGEEEDEEEEEQMEIGDEEAGEEDEKEGNVEASLLLVNTEEKIEAKSEGESQKLMVQSKLKKVVAEVKKPTTKKMMASSTEDKPGSKKKLAAVEKDKPKVLGKRKVDSTEDMPKSLGKQNVASTEEDKPNALSKKKVAATTEDKLEASKKKKVGTTAEDNPEASGKKKESKRAKSMGLIFMCNSKTKKDCYQYKVLGLPASKKDIVQKVYKGMRLFLFDIDKRLMYGIYKAAGPGGYDIQPKAFGSAFPSQVRFTVLEDCLPLGEEKFKPIIKDNYFAKKKFDCQLNSEQVRNLCKLFSSSGKVSRSKKPKNVAGAETHPDADRARVGRPRVDEERLGPGRIKRKRLDEERLAPRLKVDKERRARGRIRRPRLGEESGIRRQILDEERVDRERIRRQKLEDESWDPRYHERPVVYERERPVVYERERYASPLPPPSRAYDSYFRNAESAMYMRDPVVDHRERVPVLDHRDRQILGLDGVGIRDPYASYREYNPPPRVQAATYPHLASSSEYRLQPLASSAPEYRLPEEAPRYEYAPPRPLYRY